MGKGPRIDCSKDVKITQQNEKDDADINIIVERAKKGAIPPVGRNVAPMYGDFTEVPSDLREVLVMARRAEDLFMTLDALVRRRFNNDPAEMLDFIADPKNFDEGVKLGMLKPKEFVPPVKADVPENPVPPVKGPDSSGA